MRAIQVQEFGGPEVLRVADVPQPHPAASEVRLRIHAAGVNPVETYIRTGTYAMKPPLPYTPGTDGAGIIDALGEDVEGWRIGQRVYTFGSVTGTYAEEAICKTSQIYRLPEGVGFEQGAALGVPYATAYRALFQRARALPGDTVLIHGASGGVGIAAVQLARAGGLTVIGTAGTAKGRELVVAQGAHHALDHTNQAYLSEVMSLTQGRGARIILEMLANVNLEKDLAMLAPFGTVVVIGNRGRIEINPRDVMAKEAAILGMVLFNTPPEEMTRIHAALAAGLENGSLRPVIGLRLPLAEAPRAHKSVMEPGAHGKIVLLP